MPTMHSRVLTFACGLLAFAGLANPAFAQAGPNAGGGAPTYADLAQLADGAPLVIRVRIADQAVVEPERAPGLAPGHVRLYVEAQTLALLVGSSPVGQSLSYLIDLPKTPDGDAPDLEEREVILFARAVPGRAGELQLAKPGAQLAWSPAIETRLRPILAALHAPDSPPRVTGVGDALSVAGNLVGESETQIFLKTQDGSPASLTVVRRPGMAPRWGVSWSEIVDRSATPPEPETLAWYRLACGLPPRLPPGANLARDPQDRARAAQDYAFVIDALGPCRHNRR